MSALVNLLRKGGGDEFVAVRAYTEEAGGLFCDLYAEGGGIFYSKCPVLQGMSTTIPAPSVVWDGKTTDGYPRVIAIYRSAKSGVRRNPVVLGVVDNGFAAPLTPQQEKEANTQAKESPQAGTLRARVQDASVRTARAGMFARENGNVDSIAMGVATTVANSIILGDGRSELDRPALATALAEALEPLYEAVNQLITFCNQLNYPPPLGGITITTIPTPAGPVDIGMATIPYAGEPAVAELRPDSYESPVVQIASQ